MKGGHSQRQKRTFSEEKKKIRIRAVSTPLNLWKEEELMGSQKFDAVPCISKKEEGED